jgi:sugar-specific transcriptional regulator TrmB
MDLKYVLQEIGLDEKESKVYLAALKLGQSPGSGIAKKADLNRVSTYDVLKRLNRKGLVSYVIRAEVRHYSAMNPEILVNDYKQKVRNLEKALPELRGLQVKGKKPSVRFFEGIQGIKMIYEDSLTSGTEILNFSNSKAIRMYWPSYDEEYVLARARKKIMLRGISPLDEYGLKVQKEDKKYYRHIRLVNAKEFQFTNEINIYDDKIAICSFHEDPYGIIIQSREMADTQRDIFSMAWKYAEMEEKTRKAKEPQKRKKDTQASEFRRSEKMENKWEKRKRKLII